MIERHIITGEFPPEVGGVGDYTASLATALAVAGEQVHVWCGGTGGTSTEGGVEVHRELGRMRADDLARLSCVLERVPAPRRLLVQWVPHAYGYRSLNIGFCRWLLHRRKRHADVIDVIVHEPFLPFSVRLTITAAAAVQRVMAWELLRAATRVWVVTPAWERCLRPYSSGRDLGFRWIPVPSTIPVVDDVDTTILRERLRTGALLVGAFGTGDRHVADVWRRSILPLLARDPRINVRLLGRHSHAMRASLLTGTTALADRVHATGVVGASELSAHLRACDVAIEPYADGICGRHTSAMAFLAHARPLVTTSGRFTEPVWSQSGGVVLVPSNDARGLTHEVTTLLDNPDERMRVGDAGHRLYECRFAIRHTVTALQAVTA